MEARNVVKAVWGHLQSSPAPDVHDFCGQGEPESFPSFEDMKGREGQHHSFTLEGTLAGVLTNLLHKAGSEQVIQGFIQTSLHHVQGSSLCIFSGKQLPALQYPRVGKVSPCMCPDPLFFQPIASCPCVLYHGHKPDSALLGPVP